MCPQNQLPLYRTPVLPYTVYRTLVLRGEYMVFIGFSKREFIQSFLAAVSMVGTVYLFSVGFLLLF